ncbi:hypothetical protein PHET_05455 [Paragonimus heterotremus]|uniref:Ion transport domain-containing protein n=1 Tax=Paragonimus heterotremus TaxID=100268 RepID=A0A8J4TKU1_9TREM|nr:hypothetical protein PHET_05455 [Paragonimus heterotremus]
MARMTSSLPARCANQLEPILLQTCLVQDSSLTDDSINSNQLIRKKDSSAFDFILLSSFHKFKEVVNLTDENSWTLLHHAVRAGDISVVRTLVVTLGAAVNVYDSEGLSPLHVAAKCSLQTDYDQGANLLHSTLLTSSKNTSGDYKSIPEKAYSLQDSSHKIPHELIEFLIKKGAKVDEPDSSGMTPLHYTASRNKVNAARQLLLAGATLEFRDFEGMTPLLISIKKNKLDMVKLFLEANANYLAVDARGNNVFHYSCAHKGIEVLQVIIQFLMKKDEHTTLLILLNAKNHEGEIPLHRAATVGATNIVKSILEIEGSDPLAKNNRGETCLHLVARGNHVELVPLLLAQNVDINATDNNGESALFVAVRGHKQKMVRELLNRGSDVDLLSAHYVTPIMVACQFGYLDLVEVLIEKGADLRLEDENYKTALTWAIENVHADVVMRLLQMDDAYYIVRRPDITNNTALHQAAENGDVTLLRTLLKAPNISVTKNHRLREPMHLAAMNGNIKAVELLLEFEKESIWRMDEDGNTPLHLAALEGFPDLVQLLSQQFPAVGYAKNDMGRSPLLCAASKNRVGCVKVLLERREPDINGVDKSELTALFLACQRGYTELVRLLLKNGADPTLRASSRHEHYPGWNPLNIAVEGKHLECVIALIESSFLYKMLKNRIVRSNGFIVTPLMQMIRILPEAATLVMDKCIDKGKVPVHHPNYCITFNFEFLDETEETEGQSDMVNNTRTKCCSRKQAPSRKKVPSLMDQNVAVPLLSAYHVEEKGLERKNKHLIHPLQLMFAQFWKFRLAYFNMQNFIELTIYISAVLTTIDTNNCMRVTGLREHWQWQIGTIGLTLAWVNLLLYSQNSGRIGIYVGIPFIIAFVLAFHLLLANQYAYMSIESALAKVIVMISGELEFVQALFSRYQSNASSDVHVRYVTLTYVLFIVFIIVMAIALTNMLIGLAVGDVKEIQSQAIISKLRITIQTLFEAEDLLKTLRIKRDIPKMYVFFPNSKKSLMDKAFNWLYTPKTKADQVRPYHNDEFASYSE